MRSSTVIIFISIVAAVVAVFAYAQAQVFVSSQSVSFEIQKGQSAWSIAQELSQQHIIRSPLLFFVQAFFMGESHNLKPGSYQFTSGSNAGLIRMLAEGPQEITVTVTPGMRVQDIDTRLAQSGIITAGDLVKILPQSLRLVCSACSRATALEGILAPDTYRFYRKTNAYAVAQTMAREFENWLVEFSNGKTYTDADMYKKIIIASLLEKEVTTYHDKQLVAGIIYKRLAIGMPLQIDASVLYGVCGNTQSNACGLTKDDFKIDSPFNTYTRKGLPLTPIASPSRESLQAAFNPQASSYLYYLTDPQTKETRFSETFYEHDSKRGIYLIQ